MFQQVYTFFYATLTGSEGQTGENLPAEIPSTADCTTDHVAIPAQGMPCTEWILGLCVS